MGKYSLRGLYAVTPDQQDTDRLLSALESVLAGGCRIVQYRNKSADTRLRREQAQRVVRLCRDHSDVVVLINDDVELARDVGADGVHLGGDDGDPGEARRRLGHAALLGISCYNEPERVRLAMAAGADYVALGAMFPSSTKPGAVRASLELLRDIKAICPLPVAAIGGITLGNAGSVIAAGADMVAVVGDLFEASDRCDRAMRFQSLFKHS